MPPLRNALLILGALGDLETNYRYQCPHPHIPPRNPSIRDKPIQEKKDHEGKGSAHDGYHGIPEEVAIQ